MNTLAKRISGFTLIELMVTVAVMGIILAWGIPSFRNLLQNTRATSQANEFITSVNQARTEALKRQSTVSVIAAAGGTATNEFGNGWSVVVDADGDGVVDAGDVRVATSTGYQGRGTLNSVNNVSAFTFQRDGTLGAVRGFEVRIPDCRGTAARNISISRIGHVSVASVACQ
ncbi:MAG: GspH/FimT family pseudopilin [Arenimonas sp.]|nr:GspH/FimT family pseudopilin [Arenimonas sp.]